MRLMRSGGEPFVAFRLNRGCQHSLGALAQNIREQVTRRDWQGNRRRINFHRRGAPQGKAVFSTIFLPRHVAFFSHPLVYKMRQEFPCGVFMRVTRLACGLAGLGCSLFVAYWFWLYREQSRKVAVIEEGGAQVLYSCSPLLSTARTLARRSTEYSSIDACRQESTNRSRFGQSGEDGAYRNTLFQCEKATGARAIGVPEWPLFAFCTPSIERVGWC